MRSSKAENGFDSSIICAPLVVQVFFHRSISNILLYFLKCLFLKNNFVNVIL